MVAAAAAAADDNVASHASQPGQAGRRGEICRNRRVLGGVGERESEREGESLRFADASLLRSVDIWRPHCREGGREEGKAREREKGRERDKI